MSTYLYSNQINWITQLCIKKVLDKIKCHRLVISDKGRGTWETNWFKVNTSL